MGNLRDNPIAELTADVLRKEVELQEQIRTAFSLVRLAFYRTRQRSSACPQLSQTEIHAASSKKNIVESDVLERFQDRVCKIEFIRSDDPMTLRTVLHLSPKGAATDA